MHLSSDCILSAVKHKEGGFQSNLAKIVFTATKKCARGMNLVEREKAGKEGVLWRCPRKGCRREVSLRKDTFFEGSHLEIEKILRILHLWSTKTPLNKMRVEVEVSTKTAVDWYNFVRDVCAQYYIDHPAVIGGPNVEVEIDESKFGKRKYNRGRTVDGHWVFGGVERITGECFLVEVQQRDAATLLPIVQNFVRPGSIVYSDEWAAYNQLAASAACQHQTVNHSIHFVDPQTGAHTQGIEGLWSACKRMMREEHAGRNAELFPTYLQEYMWRRRFGGPTTFCNIIKHIAEQYPL